MHWAPDKCSVLLTNPKSHFSWPERQIKTAWERLFRFVSPESYKLEVKTAPDADYLGLRISARGIEPTGIGKRTRTLQQNG